MSSDGDPHYLLGTSAAAGGVWNPADVDVGAPLVVYGGSGDV